MKSEENKTEPYLFTKGFLTGRKVPSDHVNTCAPAPLLLSEAFLSYNVVDDFIQQKVPLTGILYYLGLFVNEVLFDEKSRQCRHRRSEYFLYLPPMVIENARPSFRPRRAEPPWDECAVIRDARIPTPGPG